MWDRVKARKHKIHRVFAAAPGSPEIMLYGEVKQTLWSGGDLVKEWAAHGVLEKSAEDGKWRWAFYQVYLARSFFPLPGWSRQRRRTRRNGNGWFANRLFVGYVKLNGHGLWLAVSPTGLLIYFHVSQSISSTAWASE